MAAAASTKEKHPVADRYLRHCEAITNTQIYSNTFYWKIQNFKNLHHKAGEYIWSPTFHTYGDDGEQYKNLEWYLQLFPRGDKVSEDNEEYLSLYMYCVGLHESNEGIHATCELYCGTDKDSSNIDRGTLDHVFKEPSAGAGYGWRRFHRLPLYGDEKQLLDEFVITCRVQHPGQPITTSVTPSAAGYRERLDLLPMYNDSLWTDVIISTETREFKAHKVVLAAKSNVFKALLTSDFSEASSNAVKITDVSANACELMLLHMYGKKLPDDIGIDTAESLLYLSEKYEMDVLKADCEVMLSSMISVTNVWRLLAAGEKYRGEALKQCCQKFIGKNSKKILDVMTNNAGALGECTLNDITGGNGDESESEGDE